MIKQGVAPALAMLVLAIGCLPCALVRWPIVRGSGHVVEAGVDVSGFSAVELACSGDLAIVLGDEEALRVEAEDNLIAHMDIRVDGDTLKIGYKPAVWLISTRPVRFYVTAKSLDTVVLTGSGDIAAPDLEGNRVSVRISGSGSISTGELAGGDVDLHISGSGEMDVEGTDAGNVSISVSGSGDVRVATMLAHELETRISGSGTSCVRTGTVDSQSIRISGSGEHRAIDVNSRLVNIRISGSGSADVTATKQLEVVITGSGDVRYAGSPETLAQDVSGSGDVIQIAN